MPEVFSGRRCGNVSAQLPSKFVSMEEQWLCISLQFENFILVIFTDNSNTNMTCVYLIGLFLILVFLIFLYKYIKKDKQE